MIAALLALFLLASSPLAEAQAVGTGPGTSASSPAGTVVTPSVPPGSEPLATAGEAPAVPAEKPAPNAQDLLADTVAKDIDTASYYELVTWCDELGLDNSGSRQELQARMAKHYGVTLPKAPVPGKRSVTVKSARESEYFTQSETGEKYVLLRGDVVVEVRDLSDGTLQVIKAASLTFNQTRRTMSAVGDVTYTLTKGSQTDTFTGKSLDFDLDSSEAVFYDGTTRRIIKRATGDMPYTFAGETITRVSNDTIILHKGAFTSSDTPSDPLYQVRAGTVWLLAPGEWAVQDAVLYVGRVPLMYLPGFFWPGDDFFFNPNVGYKTREGSFLQTTTYLIGRKAKQDSPFSFLQLSGSGDAGYATEPHGLFLRKIPGSAPPKDDGHSLKLELDAYSRLGFMAGVAGDFSPIGTFRTSIGVSRSIFQDPTTQLYTPYLPISNPPYTVGQEFWNSSSVFGLGVPFRYGLEGALKTSGTAYSLNADFQYFSDPSFTTDFYTRSESGMLSALFTQASTSSTATAATAATPQQTNLSWDLSGKMDFTKMVNQPFISNLSLQSLDLKMTWQSNTPSGLSDPQASDPGRTFYYPSSITAPNVSFAMSGDIVSLGGGAPAPAAPATSSSPGTTTPAALPGAAAGTAQGASAAPGPASVTPFAAGSRPPAAVPDASAGTATAPGKPVGTLPAAAAPATPAAPAAPPAAPPAPEATAPGKGLHGPALLDVEVSPAKEPGPAGAAPAARIPFRSPEPLEDEQLAQAQQATTFKLSYQIQPRATLEHTFDTANWTTAQSVNYALLYRTFETGGTSSLTAAASFWDRLADTSLTLSADGLWRSRFDPSAGELASADWPNALLLDQQQDRLAFRSAFQGTVHPFPALSDFSTSSLQYKINVRMYQLGLTGTDPFNPVLTPLGPAWSADAVSEHSFASTLALVTPATNDDLAVTLQLPPLVPTTTARIDARGGVFSGRAQGGFASPPTGIQYQPLVVSASVDTGAAAASAAPAPGTAAGTSSPSMAFTASEELQFDVSGSVLSRSTSQVGYAGASIAFVAQNTGAPNNLVPSTVKFGYEPVYDPLWYWKDRVKIIPGLKTHWYLNIQNYIDNLFDFSPSLTLSVYKNLDLTFSSTSNNTRTYLYIPGWTGLPWVNPLTDLLQSFNFANSDDRKRSGFKIQNLSLKAVQHFPDWDLTVQYQASPQLITHTNPVTNAQYVQNEWSPTFSILVQWNAVSEVKSTIHQEYTGTPTVPSLR
jgi:hypothetical protein